MTKICSYCKQEKSKTKFNKNKSRPDGLNCHCSECRKVYAKQYYLENKNKILESNKVWYSNNKTQHQKLVDAWYNRNKAVRREKDMRRYASKKKATPIWADKESILSIYKEAEYFGMEVDHIVPLRSKKVCGLHCEQNMQLLYKEENRNKSNRYWDDM